jgi:lactoylglutathione lyase
MMGYGPEDKNAVLELTYNYGITEYDKGNAYGQVRDTLAFQIQ